MKKKIIEIIGDEIMNLSDEKKRTMLEKFIAGTLRKFEELTTILGVSTDFSGEMTNKKTGSKYTFILKCENPDEEEEDDQIEKEMSN